MIDRINGESIKPIKLKLISESVENEEASINATVGIKTLVKKFQKGINTIEIAYSDDEERTATEIVVNIQIKRRCYVVFSVSP